MAHGVLLTVRLPCSLEDKALTDEKKDPNRDHLFQPGHAGGPGRPPLVPTPEQCRQAKTACQLGATDLELSAILGVSVPTIKRWQVTDETFAFACKVGGDMADARVERALFSRAIGGTKKGVREALTKAGEIVALEWEEDMPADPHAASRWLEVRQRKDWGLKATLTHEGDIEVRDSRSALEKLVGRHRDRQG